MKCRYFLLFLFLLSGCSYSDKFDSNSPEGVILRVEQFHRTRNLDSLIVITDFETSARLVLIESGFPITDSTIFSTAEALKLSMIKQINEDGFADFGHNHNHQFSNKKFINDSILSITDENSGQELLVVKRKDRWFYIGPK